MINVICSWTSLCLIKSIFRFILLKFNGYWLVSSTKRSRILVSCWSRTYILWNFCLEKAIKFCFSLNYKFWSRRKCGFEIVGTWAWCIWSISWDFFSGQCSLNCHHIGLSISRYWTLFWLQASMSWSTCLRNLGWFSIIWKFSLCEITRFCSFRSSCYWGRSICAWLTVIISHYISSYLSIIQCIILRRPWSLPKSPSFVYLFDIAWL